MTSMTADIDESTNVCVLISASCTTSWFDWIHGELWLCPNGLARRSLGLWKTIRHGSGRTVDPTFRPTRTFTPDEVNRILGAGRRNRWILWSDVSHAILKRGVIDHSLHLDLRSGGREKFLWLGIDGGFDLLEPVLSRSLGDRFEIQDRAIG